MTTISPRSKAFRAAAKSADWWTVCLVGWSEPRPLKFGDNSGGLPLCVVITRKEELAHVRTDQETPHVTVEVLESVLVPSEAHAKRLKSALVEILMGEQEEASNAPLRSKWRNVRHCWDQDSPDAAEREMSRGLWWSLVLEQAQRMLRQGASEFPLYDADQVHAMISRKAVRGH